MPLIIKTILAEVAPKGLFIDKPKLINLVTTELQLQGIEFKHKQAISILHKEVEAFAITPDITIDKTHYWLFADDEFHTKLLNNLESYARLMPGHTFVCADANSSNGAIIESYGSPG